MNVDGAVHGRRSVEAFLHSCGPMGPLLYALFASPVVGVAVMDSQMRYCAVNGALAAINGMPAPKHLGRTLRHVLGDAAQKVEGMLSRALQTGEPVPNLEVTAQLPSRAGRGRWVVSFLPIHHSQRVMARVAALVVEVTDRKNLDHLLMHLISGMLRVATVLRAESQCRETSRQFTREHAAVLSRAVELIEKSIADTRSVADAMRRYPSVNAPQRPPTGADPVRTTGIAAETARIHERKAHGQMHRLTRREHQVVRLVTNGKSNKEVASALGISVRTAETYRARIMMKLELHSVAELVRYGLKLGVVSS